MRLTTERTIYDLVVERREAELTSRVVIEVEANGFLYNMVRNIVGTLVQIGKGKAPVSFAGEALAAKDRQAAGMTAPPQGLFLVGVEYDGNDDPARRKSVAMDRLTAEEENQDE
jgi:tRNA pseudouridine38-40 synthase